MTEGAISRASFLVAGALAGLGALRLASDVLTDANPTWAASLDGTWPRHVVRVASDGTLAGDLNVQFFKILAIPCGVAVAYWLNLVTAGSLDEADRRWRSRIARAVCVGALFALCTLIELEKATHAAGLPIAGVLEGENTWMNHAVHLLSGLLGFELMRRLRYGAPPS